MARIDLQLEAKPESVGQARRALDRIAGMVTDPLLEDLRLMVSEVVTNSIRHGRVSREDRIRLLVAVQDRMVRVEVVNPGDGFHPPSIEPSIYQISGWGLYLVSQLADRWGVDGQGGTRVWFEIGRNGARESRQAS